MEPHGFLSGKCKHGSSNLCTPCDIEGHPERYTEKLLLEVALEIIEARRVPLSFDLGTKIMIWYDATRNEPAEVPQEKPLRGMVWQSDEELPTGV